MSFGRRAKNGQKEQVKRKENSALWKPKGAHTTRGAIDITVFVPLISPGAAFAYLRRLIIIILPEASFALCVLSRRRGTKITISIYFG